jgi:hypothetical protein
MCVPSAAPAMHRKQEVDISQCWINPSRLPCQKDGSSKSSSRIRKGNQAARGSKSSDIAELKEVVALLSRKVDVMLA